MAKKYYQEVAGEKDKKKYDKYTAEDEELVLVTGFAPMYLKHRFVYFILWPGILFIVVAFGFGYFTKANLGFALLWGLLVATIFAWWQTWKLNMSNKYLLTTRRVLIKRGFLAVRLYTALYDKITHIEVDQGFVDRVFLNHGNVIIHTAGANKDELNIKFVEAPIQFKNLLERLINREREQYGGRSGPVVTLEGELVE